MTFKPAARLEFFEAIAWYEGRQPGLGLDFARKVIQALQRARQKPELFPKVRGARKLRLKRFNRYSIYFAVKEETFSVIAVFHSSRNPAELRR